MGCGLIHVDRIVLRRIWSEKMKKTVFIDTNMPNSDGSYYIDEIIINGRGLKNGDEVIAYQEGEEWDAVITFNDGKWGVELKSHAMIVSDEKQHGYREGFWEGYYCQVMNLFNVLKQAKISQEELNFIINKMYRN